MAQPLDIVKAGWDGARPKVSVVILTLDEEINIAECVESCAWCDDVHVLDSGSKDRTAEIARSLGARVWYNKFTSFGEQRNWAIDNIPCKHEWIFHLDADERFTPELVNEIEGRLGEKPPEAGFYAANQAIFMGEWIKWASGYPTYQMRLFHRKRMRFVDHGHGQREQSGTLVGRLDWPYVHHSFSKGLDDWFLRHNRYSTAEAIEILQSTTSRLSVFAGLLSTDSVERRRGLKRLAYWMPLRPQLRWLYTVFLQGGLFDGSAGLLHADLLGMYERMIQIKLRALRMQGGTRNLRLESGNGPPSSAEVAPALMVPGAQGGEAPMVQAAQAIALPLPPHPAPQLPVQISLPAPRVEAMPVSREPDPPSESHASQETLPATTPGRTTWSRRQNLVRAVWMLLGQPIFRMTFHNWYGVRSRILISFGARLGKGVKIRPTVRIDIPWNLDIGDDAVVGDFAILYALGPITIGPRSVVSQYSHLCAGTHDHTSRDFKLLRPPIVIGCDCWIATDAYVGPGVVVGDRAILGARSSAYKSMDADTIYAGNPAKAIKKRELERVTTG